MTISYSYDPEDPVFLRMEKYVFGQWRSLSEMIAIAVMLLLIYGVSQTLLYMVSSSLGGVDPVAGAVILCFGVTLGLVSAYMVMVFVSRYRDLVAERELELGNYRKGPIRVELDKTGISTRSPGQARQIAWVSVRAVVSTPHGLCLRLDDRDFLPVPDGSLAEGLPREEVAEQIRKWRAVDG